MSTISVHAPAVRDNVRVGSCPIIHNNNSNDSLLLCNLRSGTFKILCWFKNFEDGLGCFMSEFCNTIIVSIQQRNIKMWLLLQAHPISHVLGELMMILLPNWRYLRTGVIVMPNINWRTINKPWVWLHDNTRPRKSAGFKNYGRSLTLIFLRMNPSSSINSEYLL